MGGASPMPTAPLKLPTTSERLRRWGDGSAPSQLLAHTTFSDFQRACCCTASCNGVTDRGASSSGRESGFVMWECSAAL